MIRETTDSTRRERFLVHRDLPQIMRIEAHSLPASSRWTEREFLTALARQEVCRWVVEDHKGVAGYLLLERRPKYRLSLLTLVVAPDVRLQGIGRQLVGRAQAMVDGGSSYRSVDVLVRERNVAAQLFFRSLGFIAIRTRRQFFASTDEDGYLFRYES